MALENMPTSGSDLEKIREMMKENLALTKETHAMVHKIKGYINFQKFMSFVYFLLIAVPIILGIIYLPPLLKNMLGQYEQILDMPQGALQGIFKTGTNQIDLNKVKPQIENLLKTQGK
jgi:hypothetical protein